MNIIYIKTTVVVNSVSYFWLFKNLTFKSIKLSLYHY